MPSFKDARGNEWNPRITAGTLASFEEETGESLFEPKVIKEIQTGRRLAKMLRLAYLACRRQALKRQVSREDFLDLIESDAQTGQCVAAVVEALTLFTRSRGRIPDAAGAKTSPGPISTP